jgi:hypothetical protein
MAVDIKKLMPSDANFVIDPRQLNRRFVLKNFIAPAHLDFQWGNLMRLHVPEDVYDPDEVYRPLPASLHIPLVIHLFLQVPDRDSGRIGSLRFTRVMSMRGWWNRVLFERELEGQVRELIREAVLHEVDESLHIDGVRKYDPHAQEPQLAELAAARLREAAMRDVWDRISDTGTLRDSIHRQPSNL